jgi:mediator of RNA polymerase II transcription subunit 17, fungi type
MALGDGPPLSLRPFPVADKKPKNLGEFIARVNAQPGGFRLLSEARLREQAALNSQKDKDAVDEADMDMSDGDEEDEEDEEDAANDPGQARMEVLKNIE